MSKILIVDDRATNRQFLLTLLGYTGHRLLEAANGEQALEVVRAERPELVITDILMPTMDGYEFVQRLRADPELEATAVIFYSATYGVAEARELADKCGVEIVLPKPSEPQEIFAAVSQVLGDGGRGNDFPEAARTLGATDIRELSKIGDLLVEYTDDLQSVKRAIEGIAERGARLAAERERVREMCARFGDNLASLQGVTSRLTALEELSIRMMSEQSPARLVEIFLGAAIRIVGCRYAAIGILGADEQHLAELRAEGMETELLRSAALERSRLPGSLLEAGEPRREASTKEALPGLPAGHPAVHSLLGVRLEGTERVCGWLYFAGKLGAPQFNDEDERIVTAMAAQIAVRYENATLYDVVQHHAARLQIEVSERKHAEVALKESEARFRELVEQASDGIFVTDGKANFLLVNPRYCQMLAYREDELLKLNTADTYPAGEAQELPQRLAKLREGKSLLFERSVLRKDGTSFPAEISIRMLSDGTHQGIVRDITERKQAQKALADSEQRFRGELEQRVAEATSQLVAANKELEAFSYSASHDLRAPLHTIDGFSRALQEDYGDKLDADGRHYLDRLRAAAQHMAQLVDDLLKLSRLTRVDMVREPVDLGAIVRSAAEKLRAQDPTREVAFDIAAGETVHGDKRLFAVLMDNLLGNAWKFTSKRQRANIGFGAKEHEGERVYYVSDNGAGFDMAHQEKLFVPFQRLHVASAFPGNGIGLATVRRIVARHGGRIWAEGAPEKGATFYFTLPGTPAAATAATPDV